MDNFYKAFFALLVGLGFGCESRVHVEFPLRPLIYTEQRDKDPRLAALREARFLREYEGKTKKVDKIIPRPESFETLGKAIFDRLISRDVNHWEALWSDKYILAEEFGWNLPIAEENRDLAIADSKIFWDQFDPGKAAERRPKGVADLLMFKSFEPGSKSVGVNADHYKDSRLFLELKNANLVLTIPIPYLLVKKGKYYLVSPFAQNKDLQFLRDLGFHLRPDLQDPADFIIPLKVGNYWRYRLTDNANDLLIPDIFEEGLSNQEGASTKTVEIISIDRISTRRLIHFNVSYDDENHSSFSKTWVTTPTKIFECNRMCIKAFPIFENLIAFLRTQEPYLENADVKKISVNVPMGQFDELSVFHSTNNGKNNDFYMKFNQEILLKPHIGIVFRKVERPEKPYELLTKYRILP